LHGLTGKSARSHRAPRLLFLLIPDTALLFLAGHVFMVVGGIGTPASDAAMSRRVYADRQGSSKAPWARFRDWRDFAGL